MRSTDDWVIFQPILRVRQCSVAFKYTKYHCQTSKFQAYHSPQQICTANMYNHYIVPPCCEEHMCFCAIIEKTYVFHMDQLCLSSLAPPGHKFAYIWRVSCTHVQSPKWNTSSLSFRRLTLPYPPLPSTLSRSKHSGPIFSEVWFTVSADSVTVSENSSLLWN